MHAQKLPSRIHCIGIGGIGVSALAKWFKAQGAYVSGSDAKESEIAAACKEAGVQVWYGEHPEKMGADIDLVVYSGAVPLMHEERIRGRHLGAREVVYNQVLGEVCAGKPTIAITGTKGKSSTTAMIGLLLEEAGLDPTVVVGAKVPGWKQGNLRVGNDAWWVVEACEHQAHMMHVTPSVAVITNVAWDHPDFYANVEAVEEAMIAWVKQWTASDASEPKVLVWNASDASSRKVYEAVRDVVPADVRVMSFCLGDTTITPTASFTRGEPRGPQCSQSDGCDCVQATVQMGAGEQIMTVSIGEQELGVIHLYQPGAYSVQNALATIAVGEALTIPFETTKRVLESYAGIWRRFEKLGEVNGVAVYTDYAHNPMSVRGLLEGAKSFFPGRRIVCVYEPHQRARTKELLTEFIPSFDAADALVLAEIYGVKGREKSANAISSADVAAAIQTHDAVRGVGRAVEFVANVREAIVRAAEMTVSGDVLLCVGAGTIDETAREWMAQSVIASVAKQSR